MTYQHANGRIFLEIKLGTGNRLQFAAENIRRERTGVHATVGISMNGRALSWDNLNVERHRERTTIANAAHKQLDELDKGVWPEDEHRQAFDLFCYGLWREHVKTIVGGPLEGDPDIGPPRQLVGPYCLEGGGTFAFAPPGAGKSYTLLAMAVSLDAGCSKIWRVPEPRRAMFVNLERSKDSLRYRLSRVNAALGLDPRRPLIFENRRGRSLFDIAEGIAETARRHQVEALFVDSISRAGAGDLKEPSIGNRVVDALNSLCATWVALAHTPRADDSHIFGTMMFTAGADVEIRLTAQAQASVTGIGMEVTKINDLPKPPMSIHAFYWGPAGLEDIRPARTHEFPELEAGRGMTLAEEVADYLMQGKASATEVSAALDRNRSAVSTLLNRDRRFVLVEKRGRVAYFGLRTTEPDNTSLSE